MQLFRALKNPTFALLWSGQTLSRLGDAFYTVALAWWVLEKTGSAAVLPSANSLRSISADLAGIAGPLIAGLIVAKGGTALSFALDSLSFVLSTLFLILIPGKRLLLRPAEKDAEPGVLKDIKEGF